MHFVSNNNYLRSPEVLTAGQYFGASPERTAESLPAIGVTAVQLIQSNLTIVSPADANPCEILDNGKLLEFLSPRHAYESTDPNKRRYVYEIEEGVVEFCAIERIAPISLASIGIEVISFAIKNRTSVDRPLQARHKISPQKRGLLDSELFFDTDTHTGHIRLEREKVGLIAMALEKLRI